MRLATYNVEWFNSLFDNQGRLLEDDQWSGRQDVRRGEQLGALGIVFTALDADAVLIIEAPDGNRKRSSVQALENFSRRYGLRARRALVGFRNDTQQEIALIYDPDKMRVRHDPKGATTGKHDDAWPSPRFDGVFRWDLDVDSTPEVVRFSKPPLEAELQFVDGRKLRVIGVHIKSKAPHGARGREEILRLSIANRRKQLAQCIWLRKRVEEHLAAGDSLIVMGDFNDGPGLDEFEKLFGRSSVEIVLGDRTGARLHDPHARLALSRKIGPAPTTSRFYLADQERYLEVLLDYIMVSPDIAAENPKWRIWHPFDDPACFKTPELREALLQASDHFPVSIDLPDRA